MNVKLLNQAIKMLVFATCAQRVAWCQYYSEPIEEGRGGINEEHHEEHHVNPLYKFGYWVHDPKTKDVKNHWEHRDGDVVHGSYSLLQPDGYVRLVEYTSDKHNGFNAYVKYIHGGEAGSGGDSSGGGGFGSEHNQHLEDATGRQLENDGVALKQSLSKFYKKPRTEKPGGSRGQYKRPHYFDNGSRQKPSGGGGPKKQRLSLPSTEHSIEHFTNNNNNNYNNGPGAGAGHYERLSKFSSDGGNLKHSHPNSLSGGSPLKYHPGGEHPSNPEHFARKFSSASSTSPVSSEKSSYFTGIQHQSSEHDMVVHLRPDTSTGHRDDGVYQSSYEDGRRDGDRDADEGATVNIEKQSLREYHYDEQQPPYPFEIPENLRPSSSHSKRHVFRPRQPAVTKLFHPFWYGTAVDDYGEHPVDY